MPDALVIVALGFFLGMRHATDPDHVIAVTTIASRQREIGAAAVTGFLWGLGHTLTILAVGSAIIFFNLVIPERVGMGMELTVGLMLIVLGLVNIAAFVNFRFRAPGSVAYGSSQVHSHAHSHGDYVHSHPHGHGPDVHPHAADRTPLAAIDRTFGRSRIYSYARPAVVGLVHGLAGSAAVTLIVVATVTDPYWAVAYLIVFGVGTIAGMMLITMSIASVFQLAGSRSPAMTGRLGLACGMASIAFGVFFAYGVWMTGSAH